MDITQLFCIGNFDQLNLVHLGDEYLNHLATPLHDGVAGYGDMLQLAQIPLKLTWICHVIIETE